MADDKKPDSGRIRTPMSPATWADEEPLDPPPGVVQPEPEKPEPKKPTTKKAS